MARYGLIIDVDRCSGCYNCFVACKDEHCGNDHLPVAASQPEMGHYWMNIVEKERGQYPKVKVASIPVTCMQCAEAPCLAAAAAAGAPGAVYRRDDGIVIIDPVKSKGRRELVEACPYGVIFWNEAAGLPQKCTLCAHLLDAGWREPRCVEACPTGALIFGDLHDSATEIAVATAAGGLEELHPGHATKPTTKYRGLPRKFVAGTVYLADVDECAEGVDVVCRRGDVTLVTTTNAFGDFEFEGLEDDTHYAIIMYKDGYAKKVLPAYTTKDQYLGDILLLRES
jgi:Fe-S-cluster-containing dehydrogenase component